MGYSDWKPWKVVNATSIVNTAGTDLFKFVLPTGHKDIQVFAITQVVTATAGDTTSGAVRLVSGSTTKQTCTGIGISAAIGVATYDVLAEPCVFKAGDTLIVEIAVTATTTGSVDVILWID